MIEKSDIHRHGTERISRSKHKRGGVFPRRAELL
jgi:hypothetical protein